MAVYITGPQHAMRMLTRAQKPTLIVLEHVNRENVARITANKASRAVALSEREKECLKGLLGQTPDETGDARPITGDSILVFNEDQKYFFAIHIL